MECTAGFFASLLCWLMLEPCRELQINYCSLSIQKYSWFIRNHLEHTKSDTICMTKKLKIVRDVSAEKNSTTLPVWVGSSQGKNARNNHACGWLRMGSAYAVLKTDFCQISPNLELPAPQRASAFDNNCVVIHLSINGQISIQRGTEKM